MIIFFGSSEYSIFAVEALFSAGLKVIVITTPDKPVGRQQILTPNPLAKFSQEKGLSVFKIDQLDQAKIPQSLLALIAKAQVGICCVYGKIIPGFLIKKFKQGILNIHPSLLPKYRGASPAVGIILNEEKTSGFSIIRIDEKVDHGPIIFQEKFPLSDQITAADLYQKTFQKAADKLPKILNQYLKALLKPKSQDHQKASYTPRLRREDSYLDSSLVGKALRGEKIRFENLPPIGKKVISLPKKEYQASKIVFNLYRAFYPWPGIWTIIKINRQNKRLKIIKAHLENDKLIIDQVQLEGKIPIDFNQFKNDYCFDL